MTELLQILLVDDHCMVREGIKRQIEDALPPATVLEASGYEQAIEILNNEKIDYAYLDYQLRGNKSGLDILQYISTNRLLTRSFILSQGSSADGYLDKEIILQCMEAGAVGYLSKVVDNTNTLREAFDRANQGLTYFPQDCFKTKKKETFQVKKLEDYGMTNRLCEALYYICKPLSYADVAKKMNIDEKTVRQNYARNLFEKFDVENKEQLIAKVLRENIEIPKPKSDID